MTKIKTVGDLIDTLDLNWWKYDFSPKYAEDGNYKYLPDLLEVLGYELEEDEETYIGEYNEIRCYKGCSIRKIED